MAERYTLIFKANGKPDTLYKTNQTIFDYSKLSSTGIDYANAHKKDYVFENWTQAIKFRKALRQMGVDIRF